MKRCQEMIGFYLPPALVRPSLGAPRVRELTQYFTSGRLKVQVGATFPLQDAAEAHRCLEARRTTRKVVLVVRE